MIAIIPARGGSKAWKNRAFGWISPNMPLYFRSFDSKFISRVIVSTDDENMAEISRECGAEVPFIDLRNSLMTPRW